MADFLWQIAIFCSAAIQRSGAVTLCFFAEELRPSLILLITIQNVIPYSIEVLEHYAPIRTS